jgi:hypothetical protein
MDIENYILWWGKYVNNDQFISIFKSGKSIRLISEATYWAINLGFDKEIEKMDQKDLKNIKPIKLMINGDSNIGKLIKDLSEKLKQPEDSLEASYAIYNCIVSIYVHNNGFEKSIWID